MTPAAPPLPVVLERPPEAVFALGRALARALAELQFAEPPPADAGGEASRPEYDGPQSHPAARSARHGPR